MELNSINDYFNIAKSAETVSLFYDLTHKLAYFPEKFTKEEAKDLLYIIDNERDNLKLLAETFRKIGQRVEIIPEENWDKLRKTVLMYLIG